MASLYPLPHELLSHIFQLACDPPRSVEFPRYSAGDRASLAAFSLVQRTWRGPAQDLLLRHVLVGSGGDTAVEKLAGLCLRDEALAERIRTVQFTSDLVFGLGKKKPSYRALFLSELAERCPALTAVVLRTGQLAPAELAGPSSRTRLSQLSRMLQTDLDRSLSRPNLIGNIRVLHFAVVTNAYRPASYIGPLDSAHREPTLPILANCESLTTSLFWVDWLQTLQHSLRPGRSSSLRDSPQVFPALRSLAVTSSLPSGWMIDTPNGSPVYHGEPGSIAVDMPDLEAVSCGCEGRKALANFAWPDRVRNKILWLVPWQSFVDYMHPWRDFAIPDPDGSGPCRTSTADVPPRPRPLLLRHLYLLPLPYDPLPPHFLAELTRRIDTDPSLQNLRGLWLPTRGWHALVSRPEDDQVRERAREFREVCARKGVALRWVERYDLEAEEMPAEYREWAIAQAGDEGR